MFTYILAGLAIFAGYMFVHDFYGFGDKSWAPRTQCRTSLFFEFRFSDI